MSEWQPIETAPNDGTRVDLWMPGLNGGSRAIDCHWVANEWVDDDGVPFSAIYGYGRNPTHWMLSPEPPK